MFRRLNRSDVFFVLTLVTLYLTWNPAGFSVVGAWMEGRWPLPVGLLITTILIALLAFVARSTWRALGFLGIVIYAAIIGLAVWTLYYFGYIGPRTVHIVGWVWQPVLAFLLTLGLRWPRVKVAISGVRDTDVDVATNAH